MPKKEYSMQSPYKLLFDKDFAQALEDLCENNNITVDLETGKGMGDAFWTYSHDLDTRRGISRGINGVKSIFLHGGDDFTSRDNMKSKMWNLGTVKEAAGKRQLFVYKDNEDYPHIVSWSDKSKTMTMGERVDQLPEPERPFLLRVKQFLHSINRNWFAEECREYQQKLDKLNEMKDYFRANAQERAVARQNPAAPEEKAAEPEKEQQAAEPAVQNEAPQKNGTEHEMDVLKSFLKPASLGCEVSEKDSELADNVLKDEGAENEVSFESPALGGGKYQGFVRSVCQFARQSKENRDKLTVMAQNGTMNTLYTQYDPSKAVELAEALGNLQPKQESVSNVLTEKPKLPEEMQMGGPNNG